MTPFRSDRDADIARIDALERELDASRHRIRELEARPPAIQPGPAGPPAPAESVQWRSWRRGGSWSREYLFDRKLPIEACHQLVRTLGDRIGRRGGIELGAHRAAWRGGGRRFELAYRGGATVLTCTDHRARDSRIACAIYIVALIAMCTVTRDVSGVIGAAYVAAIACGLALRREPVRGLKSHELFEEVAELVGEELRTRGRAIRQR